MKSLNFNFLVNADRNKRKDFWYIVIVERKQNFYNWICIYV